MKNQKSPVVATANQTRVKLALKLGKLVTLIALFYSGGMNAQSSVASYPATGAGQVLLITSSHPAYFDMMNAAGRVRSDAIGYLANCGTNCEPTQYVYCNDLVCCDCTAVYEPACSCVVYYTNCWARATGAHLATILY